MRQRSANSGAFLNEATRPLILIVALQIDPDGFRESLGFRRAMNEAFRVVCPGVLQSALALFEDLLGAAVMDVAGGEHGDTGVAMLAVVPREEGPAERDRGVDVFEATREAGVVF